jgi:hypothetical protein
MTRIKGYILGGDGKGVASGDRGLNSQHPYPTHSTPIFHIYIYTYIHIYFDPF